MSEYLNTPSYEALETRGEVRVDLQLVSEHVGTYEEGQLTRKAQEAAEAAAERQPKPPTPGELLSQQSNNLFAVRRAVAEGSLHIVDTDRAA